MKHRWLWLFTLFALAACGPSAEEIASQTAAAETQIAESWTATPTATATLTPTSTPTSTPTDTPTPTPVGFDAAGLIAFNRDIGSEGVYVYTIKPSGEDETLITEDPGVFLGPAWSPDGKLLAFMSIGIETLQIDLWMADVDAGEPARQMTFSGIVIPGMLSWSPDSQYLVYGGEAPGSDESDIYIAEVETGEVTNLTQQYPGWHNWPTWSPDGEWIAFTSTRLDDAGGLGLYDIWLMKPDVSELQNLTNQPELEDFNPVWSPDGEQIAFFRRPEPDEDAETEESSDTEESADTEEDADTEAAAGLYVMNADGSDPYLVYAFDPTPGFYPGWSPDGKWIGLTNNGDIWVASVDGEEAIQISDMPGFESDVCWSPDSQTLSFSNVTEEDDRTTHIAAADGSGSRLLIDSDGLEWMGVWSP